MTGNWFAQDLTQEKLDRISAIIEELDELFPAPPRLTVEDVENLTDENADLVMIAARRMLVMQLLHQERHQHMGDDCGDYLAAATDGWTYVFSRAWQDDFQGYTAHIKNYLTDPENFSEGGCDGEIRYEILITMEDENIEEAMRRYAG